MSIEEEKRFYANYESHMAKRLAGLASGRPDIKRIHSLGRAEAAERLGLLKGLFGGRKHILEIGSSTGAFLEAVKRSGLSRRLSGIEPCDACREYSRRFTEDVHADISQLTACHQFDMICMFYVFEHIRDPLSFLASCRRYLKKKGLFLIEVPHIQDPLMSLYDCGAFKDFYFQPMHPFVYSLKALRQVFSKSGFRERRVIYH